MIRVFATPLTWGTVQKADTFPEEWRRTTGEIGILCVGTPNRRAGGPSALSDSAETALLYCQPLPYFVQLAYYLLRYGSLFNPRSV